MNLVIESVGQGEAIAKAAIGRKLQRMFPNGCKRVLLVNPMGVPEEDYDINVAVQNRYPIYPPYGLGVLSECLQRRGYEANIMDLNFEQQADLKSFPQNFKYNIWRKWLRKKIDDLNPDFVGLTCMFSVTHRAMKQVAGYVKELYAQLPVFAGGVHTSGVPELVLKDCAGIDFAGLYEGNTSLPDMLDFINGKQPESSLTQLCTIENEQYIAITERAPVESNDLNAAADYRDLKIEEYSSLGRIGTYYWLFDDATRASTVLSNRGCRAKCTFCSVRHFNGKGVNDRDVNAVVDELENLRDRYGITHIMWLDDDLFYKEKRTVQLFNEITKRNLGITWDASNGIIASALTNEIVHSASESGCIGLSLGVESGSDKILRAVYKPSTVKHYIQAGEILRNYPSIFTRGLFMCGFPGETISQLTDTINLGREMQFDWSVIQPLTLIPATELTDWALSIGKIVEEQLVDGSQRPFLGSTGKQILREAAETSSAARWYNLMEEGDSTHVPTDDEIKDVWFIMDYKINYERLHDVECEMKLGMLRKMFFSMCDRTHTGHALGSLYFALIEQKLKNFDEAKRRLAQAKDLVQQSAYWQIRFDVFGLFRLAEDLEARLSPRLRRTVDLQDTTVG